MPIDGYQKVVTVWYMVFMNRLSFDGIGGFLYLIEK